MATGNLDLEVTAIKVGVGTGDFLDMSLTQQCFSGLVVFWH